jgi:outer membrane lipoprotein-sorting protein
LPAAERRSPASRGAAALLLAALALVLLPGSPRASDGPVAGAERAAWFERLRERQSGIRAFRATVVQKRSSPLLVREETSEGRLLFGRPDRFRWETDSPGRRVVVADGKALTVWSPASNEAERYDQREQFAARMGLELLATGLGGSLADLERRFAVEASRRGGKLEVTLVPKARWFRRAVSSITVLQADDAPLPERVVVSGPRGDRTETELRDVTVNPPLPADAFVLKLPPGVRLFDAKERAERGEDGP